MDEEGSVVRRLVISSIQMENFKSYSGIQTIGPFHSFFTCIIGPNGSGKSNVIDALLFVFGFKASKIRLKNLSELVHNSDGCGKLPYAQVSVQFAEIEERIDSNLKAEFLRVIPGTEFVISRRAHSKHSNQHGSSEYFLSKSSSFEGLRKTTREDVVELLKSKGLDLDFNRFLILQFEVEQIALMPPKATGEHDTGLLEYIEDVLGTAHYKEKIENTAKDVDALTEEKQERTNNAQTAQEELKGLEKGKLECEQYLRTHCKVNKLKSTKLQAQLATVAQRLEQCAQEKEALQEKFKESHAKAEKISKELKELEKSNGGVHAELAKIQNEVSEGSRKVMQFEKKETEMKETMKNAKKKVKKQQEVIKKTEQSIFEIGQEIQKLEKERAKCEGLLVELPRTLKSREQEAEAMRAQLHTQWEPLRLQLDEHKKKLMPYSKKLNAIEEQAKVLESERDLCIENINAHANKLKKEEDLKSSLEKQHSELSAHLSTTTSQIAAHRKENTTLQERVQAIHSEKNQKNEQIKTLRTQYEEMKRAMQSTQSTNETLNFLLKKRDQGELKGLIGRLGDLGAIQGKYDIAISTACPALDNIVVEDYETGMKALELLRQFKIGRCTFIMLDKVSQQWGGQASSKMNNCPQGARRLYDLVTLKDKRYGPAFYSSLRDTLVCGTMDEAMSIAYGKTRHRVVTEQGQLIEVSGVMSGGGTVRKGGMSSSISEEVDVHSFKEVEASLRQKENEYTQINQRLDETNAQLQEVQKRLQQLLSEQSNAQTKLQGLQMTIKECAERLNEARAQSSHHDAKHTDIAKRAEALGVRLAQNAHERQALKAEMRTAEEAVSSVERQLEDVGGVEWKTLQYKLEQTKKEIDECTNTVNKCQAQMKAKQKVLEKEVQKREKEVVALDGLTATATQSEHSDGLREQLAAMKERLERALKAKREIEATLEKANERTAALKKECNRLGLEQEENKYAVEDCEKQHRQLQQKAGQSEQEIRALESEVGEFAALYGTDFLDLEDLPDVGRVERNRDEEPAPKKRKKHSKDEEERPPAKEQGVVERFMPRIEPRQLQSINLNSVKQAIEQSEEGLQKLKPNLNNLLEYREKEKEFKKKMEQLDQIVEKRVEKMKSLEGLKKNRLNEFMAGFKIVTSKLKEMYQMLTLGGDAELELVDNLDPFEGIVFSVRPPKKSWKNISNLSGGEKTLSSLSLVFALHHYKPSCLYFMDEIDAALDFKNVSIVANYIKQRARATQFIIVSLRPHMFELSDRLVGIYKTHNKTKTLSIDPHSFAAMEED